ncbi:MAG: ATP-binding protein [Saprospirales bacterium]|nr:ATP-binding protein [Saprospirales bacterium]MBK8921695.1 ATP-binding protein [Saprospirales bacterium]
MINRIQEYNIQEWLGKGKAIIVTGPRQVGKTTLVRHITQSLNRKTLWLSGDDPETRAVFDNISLARLQTVVGQHEVVVVDEAQRFFNAGLMLKLITDHLPQVQLFVTGSSSLDIASQTKENLTGRKFEFSLYPLSFEEMCGHHGYLAERSLLEHRMLYGYYPEVVNNEPVLAQKVLNSLSEGLMYRDLLTLDQIKKPSLLVKLLQALALQLGSEVSYSELAQLIGADPTTVEKYVDLLEQSFVLFRLPSLSRNVCNEIKKGRKIYFYDNGIRNAVIKNFSPLALRTDTGALWENFLLAERMKRNTYHDFSCNVYFWRTTAQQEIDYVEDASGQLHAFEFKWQAKKGNRFPNTFREAYPGSTAAVIDRENFDRFVGVS